MSVASRIHFKTQMTQSYSSADGTFDTLTFNGREYEPPWTQPHHGHSPLVVGYTPTHDIDDQELNEVHPVRSAERATQVFGEYSPIARSIERLFEPIQPVEARAHLQRGNVLHEDSDGSFDRAYGIVLDPDQPPNHPDRKHARESIIDTFQNESVVAYLSSVDYSKEPEREADLEWLLDLRQEFVMVNCVGFFGESSDPHYQGLGYDPKETPITDPAVYLATLARYTPNYWIAPVAVEEYFYHED